MLVVIRLGAHIPVPGVDSAAIANFLGDKGGALGLLNAISGGAFKNMTIFAMGIVPYINATIIMQLLTVAIPKLEQLSKESEEGRKKLMQYSRYGTVVLAAIQAFGITYGLKNAGILINPNILSYVIAILSLTAGTAFIMWIGEQITEKGIGNGISIIIFVNILSGIPQGISVFVQYGRWIETGILLLLFILIIAFVVLIQQGERRIPVQYSKKMVGRKMYGGQSTYIPIKVNIAGVISIIFAISLLQFPETIAQFFNPTGIVQTAIAWLRITHWFGASLYVLLIIFFTFFYTAIVFNPIEIANNMKKNGGFVPGIRPGKPTSDYMTTVVNRITLVGAIFYAFIAITPIIFSVIFKMNIGFGGTTLLIVVGVALETVKQLESQMLMRHYKGFLSE